VGEIREDNEESDKDYVYASKLVENQSAPIVGSKPREVRMRHRRSPQRSPLWDIFELVVYLLPLCVVAYGLWYWNGVGAPVEIKIVGYLTAFFGVLNLALLSTLHTFRLIRAVLGELTRLL
jgi:hypothetical protein